MNRLKPFQLFSVKFSRSYMASSFNIVNLAKRGLLQSIFPEDRKYNLEKLMMSSSKQTFYCGFDPTADSLHLGNLLSIMVLLHCQRAGHNPIAVVGGATAMIGDPSGKTSERPPLSPDIVDQNIKGITKDINTVFKNYAKYFGNSKELPPVKILDNREWFQKLNVIDFISTTGRLFRMGDMLVKKSVKSRLDSGEGLSLSEFTYQIFQSYDWLHLVNKHKCNIQIGGSDQMGNIVLGHNAIGKLFKGEFFGITTPIVTSTTGAKLGKSVGNALWLNPQKTSPFELYQFFVRLPDDEVEQYLKLFTFFSEDELLLIMTKQKCNPESRHAHNVLANEVVKLVHGDTGVASALACTEALYHTSIDKLNKLSQKEIKDVFKDSSFHKMSYEPDLKIIDVALKAGCFRAEDAERIIKAGGLHINTMKIDKPDYVIIPKQHILDNNISIIRIGKKNCYVIEWSNVS